MLSFDEALEKLLAGAKPVPRTKAMPTLAAAGRVLPRRNARRCRCRRSITRRWMATRCVPPGCARGWHSACR